MTDAAAEPAIGEGWVSGHLHHHQDLDSVIRGWVRPLAADLAARGWIDGFFFVRHGLGGPHVRLRLRPVAGAGEPVAEAMARSAASFLAEKPSIRPLAEEQIRRTNALILQADRHETDDSAYPDNWFRRAPFRPEVERYGGSERVRFSLDYFTLSSVAAIELLVRSGTEGRSLRLARAWELLLRQALGFALDENELEDLLRYGVDSWGREAPRVVEKGDAVAGARMEQFVHRFTRSARAVRSARVRRAPVRSGSELLAAGARALSAAIGDAGAPARVRIGASHLHMTASRLGIGNAEEVYLSRLMSVTLTEARRRGAVALPGASRRPAAAGTIPDPAEALRGLLPAALAKLRDLAAASKC